VAGVDLAAVRPVIAAAQRDVPLLLIGVVLGPIAAGLAMLGVRLLDALCAVMLPMTPAAPSSGGSLRDEWFRAARRAGCVAFPALIGGVLSPILLPALLDPRWWGAVAPAQIILLAALPMAFLHLCSAVSLSEGAVAAETRLAALQALTTIIAVAFTASYGLDAVALVLFGQTALSAGAVLLARRRSFGGAWTRLRDGFVPPALAASATGLVLWLAVEAVGAALPPAAALALLVAAACMLYTTLLDRLSHRPGLARLRSVGLPSQHDIAEFIEHRLHRLAMLRSRHFRRAEQDEYRPLELQTEGDFR
jgi:hypothetical protein